jgi:non-lysosomal glucosylceramidase
VHDGMEYAVAGTMLFEGMIDGALEIVAATRGRQDGRLRSPWNDIEYGDHYVRSMSSWALLEAAAGYRYDAGAGRMAFAPRIGAADFRCLFVASEGWGGYSQRVAGGTFHAELRVDWGQLMLRQLELAVAARGARVMLEGHSVPAATQLDDTTLTLRFAEPVTVAAGQALSVEGQTS